MQHLSHIMRPPPLSVRECVWSASGSAGRLGQDQLGNRQGSCQQLGWTASYHSYGEGVNTSSRVSRAGISRHHTTITSFHLRLQHAAQCA